MAYPQTIHPYRGLRQGEPLSSFLFILVMEGHGRMFQKDDELGQIYGICPYGAYLPISHQQFVEDIILFGLPTWIEVKIMGRIVGLLGLDPGSEVI